MKNLLLASTALISFAGVAAAETGVTISGSGRFGLINYSGAPAGTNDTIVDTRLRFNIDATTETDSGVVFGGRIRLQHTAGSADSIGARQNVNTNVNTVTGTTTTTTTTSAVYGTRGGLSPAMVYVSYEGLRVEVGNANTAFDSAALLYNSEVGYISSSAGNSRSSYFSFSSGGYDVNRMGVFASYSMNGFSGLVSYVTPDQVSTTGVNEETSIALSYENDMFTVAAAYANDGAGIADNDIWYIGGAYKGLANTTIGLNYIDEGDDGTGTDLGSTIVAYAHYTMDAWTFKGYISNNDYVGNQTDTAYGIGADYDLGGATLAGGIQRDYAEETYVDFGVRFDF